MKLSVFHLPLRVVKNSSLFVCLHGISFNILFPIFNFKSCLVLNISDVLAHAAGPPGPSAEPLQERDAPSMPDCLTISR